MKEHLEDDVYTDFYIDKTTGTFADTLVAFGIARVVSNLLSPSGEGEGIQLADKGPYYQLTFPALHEEQLSYPLSPLRPIVTAKNAQKLPADLPSPILYDDEKAANNMYWEAVKNKASELPPRPYQWDILRAINPAALPGYNGLVTTWWSIHKAQAEVLRLLFDLYSSTPNDYDGTIEAWKALSKTQGWKIDALATCQQLYNPNQGKGQNKSKADGLSIGNVDGFWLSEWLKAVGFYEVAVTRQVRGAKDRKTFVVAPRNLVFADHQSIMRRFGDRMLFAETATQFDILAVIRYLRALLDYFYDTPDRRAQLLGLKSIKKNLVSGFQTAFYKDLGNAVATMNVSFIALPGWVVVESAEDIEFNHLLLQEFEEVVRQFHEEESDAFELLQDLRDFVSGDDLTAFFRFTDAFPAYLIGRRERNKYTRQLSTNFIERLIDMTRRELRPILESLGFQNIAYAIRQSTVTAQYRKKQGERKYDVRYGLGQALARKARYAGEFIEALSDFLAAYNAENAQVMETRSGPYRRSIKTSDIDEVVHLIDVYGAPTVAKLLIAYGYARTPRDENDPLPEADETLLSEEE